MENTKILQIEKLVTCFQFCYTKMINLYYEKNTYYFYLTTTHIHDDKYMLVRSIGSANSENLLKVYIFLLAKYSRIRINTYYVMDAAKFIDKFDRITGKYWRLYPQKSEAGPIFNNLVMNIYTLLE